jgi:hypothetical protein
MMWIAGLLARWGLKESVAGKLAPWVAGLGVLAILAASVAAWDWFDDRAAIRADRDKANAAMLERQIQANDRAAGERADNAITNSEQERAFNEAIFEPQPGDSVDPAVRLACEQLRRSGQDTSSLSECGRR